MKNSVIAGTVLSSFPVIVLLRGCRDTWPQYERILLTNCQDFDQSRNPSELPREPTVSDGEMREVVGAADGNSVLVAETNLRKWIRAAQARESFLPV